MVAVALRGHHEAMTQQTLRRQLSNCTETGRRQELWMSEKKAIEILDARPSALGYSAPVFSSISGIAASGDDEETRDRPFVSLWRHDRTFVAFLVDNRMVSCVVVVVDVCLCKPV